MQYKMWGDSFTYNFLCIIDVIDLELQYFNTVEAIGALVNRLQDKV